MEYRRLGHSGLQLSELSLGSWLTFGAQIEDKVAKDLMAMAYDHGVNFFDNAEIYANGASEEVMGKLLKDFNWDRDSYVVSSKVFFGVKGLIDSKPTQKGLSRKHITEACHQALKRLQVDYLDLFFCHRPDKETPIEETVWSMHNLITQGKILYWGTSEWSAQEVMEAHLFARQNHLIGPTMEQPQYNMFHRDKMEVEFTQVFKNFGLGTTIWSPLASGVLSGKYNQKDMPNDTRLNLKNLEWLKERSITKEKLSKVDKLQVIANNLGISLPLLSIAWCLKNEYVSTVMLGASKLSQLEENLKAGEGKTLLTPEIMQAIDDVLGNVPARPNF
jgi:voltage-dependent potassium channel beta subunit